MNYVLAHACWPSPCSLVRNHILGASIKYMDCRLFESIVHVCIKRILHSASDMIQSNYSEPNCKLQVVQKDLRIVVNMSDSCDQPLHVGAAVNEVSRSRLLARSYHSAYFSIRWCYLFVMYIGVLCG